MIVPAQCSAHLPPQTCCCTQALASDKQTEPRHMWQHHTVAVNTMRASPMLCTPHENDSIACFLFYIASGTTLSLLLHTLHGNEHAC